MKKGMNDLIIQFDSSSALMKSLALHFENKDFIGVGVTDGTPEWVGDVVNRVPRAIRQKMYSWSGWKDAMYADGLKDVTGEGIAEWSTGFYPQKDFSGVMFGSSNGAIMHLAAALRMPWLPQTYLLALRRLMKPDQIVEDIEWGKKVIRSWLDKNVDLHAAQMHDPLQDRLMVSKMGYFRIKLLTIGQTMRQFMKTRIGKDRPLVSVECQFPWPAANVGERHTFQMGGFGGIDPYEYLKGSDRVKEFLKKVKAPVDHWDIGAPVQDGPEAEWGFYPQCLNNLRAIAAECHAPFLRIIFNDPEAPSAFIADLYRWWYEKHEGPKTLKMLIENFGLVSPHRVLVSRMIPFWLAFNTDISAERIEQYLRDHPDFDELYLMLMSNGVADGIGLTPIERWRGILSQAKKCGAFIGVDEMQYPLDFGTFLRYHKELIEKIPDAKPPLPDLTVPEVIDFLKRNGKSYDVQLIQE